MVSSWVRGLTSAIVIWAVLTSPVTAQSPEPELDTPPLPSIVPPESIYKLPSIFVQDVTATATPTSITGSVILENTEDILMTDVGYEIELLGELPTEEQTGN